MTGAIVNANQNTISSHQTLAQSNYYHDHDDHKGLDQDYQQGLDQDENTRRCSAVSSLPLRSAATPSCSRFSLKWTRGALVLMLMFQVVCLRPRKSQLFKEIPQHFSKYQSDQICDLVLPLLHGEWPEMSLHVCVRIVLMLCSCLCLHSVLMLCPCLLCPFLCVRLCVHKPPLWGIH